MDSPLFPQLLELFRADLSASYGSPESYYEACQVYRTYLKHKANPYRRSDGSKGSRPRRQTLGMKAPAEPALVDAGRPRRTAP